MIKKIATQSSAIAEALSSRRTVSLIIFAFALGLTAIVYYLPPPEKNRLETIAERGRLIVATRNGPTTYYEGSDGPTGLEYDLASHFADRLDVELEFVLADSISELIQMLQQGQVDIVASGMPISRSTEKLVRFSASYQHVKEQVIDLQKTKPRPRSIGDLIAPLSVVPSASHLETLGKLRPDHPNLELKIEHGLEFDELVEKVVEKRTRYALANSNEVQAVRHYYPELRIAFSLAEEKGIAWAVNKVDDVSLLNEINGFFLRIKTDGLLTELLERYYGHVSTFDYSGTRLFMKRVESRLPKYLDLFKEAGTRYLVDWRLLAAMSHQESQWNRDATSRTGVRGLMMLTLATSSQLGVTNRLDPRQSIMGGARYLAQLRKRLPESIVEPDRTWMAMAAYNVGYGHLMDAREIASLLEQDPDKWVNIKENLPLLRKRKWYKKTKHGYARGNEPVQYVQNIRRYYDILKREYGEYPHKY